jgi:hypothetical protein
MAAAPADVARFACLVLLGAAGCAQILGFEDGVPVPAAVGGSAAGAMGGDGGAGAGGGAGACEPAVCPGITDCLGASCDDSGDCALVPEAAGTPCNDPSSPRAALCDGAGECVECLGDPDCGAPLVCDTDAHVCVALHCVDDVLDAGETGVDCGGTECAPCPNGRGCNGPSDCASGYCYQNVCAPCATRARCGPAEWCDAGVCTALLANGAPCASAGSCASASCVDGVCCDEACTYQCGSCLTIHTTQPNGTCAPILSGADPDDECTADAAECSQSACNGDFMCQPAAGGTVCRPSNGVCDIQEICNGLVTGCPPDSTVAFGAPCGIGMACGFTGECQVDFGGACQQASDCASLYCADDVCCVSACDAACERCNASGFLGYCTVNDPGSDPDGECGGPADCCTGLNGCGMGNCF